MKIFKYLILVFILIIITEIILEEIGLGNPPLYKSNEKFEYINIPNQKISTLLFNYETNSYSMRSPEIDPNKENILLFGDSVLNAGRYVSNDELANYLLAKKHVNYNFLNVAAGSWGPDNAYEYLIQYGDFNAKQIILYYSSHDINDCINFMPVLGTPNFPTTKPFSGITEFITKTMYKYKKKDDISKELGISKTEEDCDFNPGWNSLITYAKNKNIPITVILHPETSEIKNKSYNEKGQRLISFLEKNNIKIIKELDYAQEKYYRDNIHMNKEGHENLANIIENNILQEIK